MQKKPYFENFQNAIFIMGENQRCLPIYMSSNFVMLYVNIKLKENLKTFIG